MSVSKMTGKLAFAMLVALGLTMGGCVVANGPGDETEPASEKTDQASSTSDKATQQGATNAAAATPAGGVSAQSTGVPIASDPEPLPWMKNNVPRNPFNPK